MRLSSIAREENRAKPFILLGHSMGSFAAQKYVLDHSDSISGLVLSGSGVLDGLAHNTQSTPPENILNAHFVPVRTPLDWLSRDAAAVNEFINDPLCFRFLEPSSAEAFLAASAELADPIRLRHVRADLPIYLFSGSEDPVGQQLEGVRVLMGRYRDAGLRNISYDFYPGGRHEMLHETNREEVVANLLLWISRILPT